ncbi:MarR family winged helix-turn-helix transcriptional regulator [Anianabacter salinae]|uniref:MarR family winged helix-turn-helix transcriptional regulator n=1 Tax=Anianabacter salinae TaxID=2851023 RepID=UPI00225E3833|nr:MarR family winged helix-turn-helix transcriptional regulator [Anianabacter salinae]MBV0912015.1 MarR family winged helix-turn-helix transcriptional regulator [Anianabacter salinae]
MDTQDAGPDMSLLERQVGYNLRRGYTRFAAHLREALAPVGLSQRTFSVLSVVVSNPGITQSDVARGLGIERSGTVVTVDELEAQGHIARTPVTGDRRAYALRATEQGRAKLDEALAAAAAHEDELLAALTPDERAMLLSVLRRIY